jgi:hypothetical protein
MSNEDLPEEILELIKPQQVRSYAIAKGWNRVPHVNGDIALFSHPRGEWDQLIVPMNERFDDYAKRVRDVIDTLSGFESRPKIEVLNDLLTTDADIVRYRVASLGTSRGSIPLMQGIRLLEGAKRSILASACSVINPTTHHPRMSRTEAQQLLGACHLGQTERASFSVSVSCPLRAVEQEQSLIEGTEPFTRRTISNLMRSLSRIVTSIEADVVPSVFDKLEAEPVLSANLCDAILQMQPSDEDSHLDIKVSWAPTLRPLFSPPELVRIKYEYFPIIEDISKKLRPATAPTSFLFVGNVDTLGGEPDVTGRMHGEATLSVLCEEQIEIVRVDLSPVDWQTAHSALGSHGIVKFRGVLHRGTRVHRITEISEFSRIN